MTTTTNARIESLSERLNTPPEEIAEMIVSAGVAAIEKRLSDSGGIVLPLEFTTEGNPEDWRKQNQSPAEVIPFPGCVLFAVPPPAPEFIPPWQGMHPNSKAYAHTMAAWLRDITNDEAEAARLYRTIRAQEIPAPLA